MAEESSAQKNSVDIGDVEGGIEDSTIAGRDVTVHVDKQSDVHTSGGTYIEGNVETDGGFFVGRDVIQNLFIKVSVLPKVVAIAAIITIFAGVAGFLADSWSVMKNVKLLITDNIRPITWTGVSFDSPDNPNLLNPIFKWYHGDSTDNDYQIDSMNNAISLIAGPKTNQWGNTNTAPMLLYSTSGNFSASVKLLFKPTYPQQMAGIGIRSVPESNRWLRIMKIYGWREANQDLLQYIQVDGGYKGKSWGNKPLEYPYFNSNVYLRIHRKNSIITFEYSSDGDKWTKSDHTLNLSNEVELYLIMAAWHDKGGSAQFEDFQISEGR